MLACIFSPFHHSESKANLRLVFQQLALEIKNNTKDFTTTVKLNKEIDEV